VLRISATPVRPSDGAKLAEQVVSVTRGTFEYEQPDLDDPAKQTGPDQRPDPDVPHGHS
jgi:hypothetical protein